MEPELKSSELPARNISMLVMDAAETAQMAVTTNTKRAYRADWEDYLEFCDVQGVSPTPPDLEIILAYFKDLSTRRKMGTVRRRRFGLQVAFEEMGHDHPFDQKAFKLFMKGLGRQKAGEGIDQPLPITRNLLEQIVTSMGVYDDPVKYARDKAIISLGLAAGGRRVSEIAALTIRDLEFDDRGVRVRIRKSKTDQEGKGRVVGVEYSKNEELCAVRAITAWMDAGDVHEGRLFRRFYRGGRVGDSITPDAISRIIKGLAQLAGLPWRRISGHSVRHGFTAQASMDGASMQKVMAGTLHTSPKMVATYMQSANPYDKQAQVI